MSKYIDAEKLIAHIEAKMEILWDRLPDADKEHPTDIELRDLGMYMALEGLIDDLDFLQQEQPEEDLEKEIDDYLEPIKAWRIREAPFTSMENCARHFAKWGRKQVLQEIYDGKVKPVDKITAAWIDDESKAKEE